MPQLIKRFAHNVVDPTYNWRGNEVELAFRALGADFRGTLKVTDTELILNVDIPLWLRLFEGTVETEARNLCDELCGG